MHNRTTTAEASVCIAVSVKCCYSCLNACLWPIWKRQKWNETGKTRANTQTIHSTSRYTLFDFRMEIYRPNVVKAQSRVYWDDLCKRTNMQTNQLHIYACIGASINVFDYFYFIFSFSLSFSLSRSPLSFCLSISVVDILYSLLHRFDSMHS